MSSIAPVILRWYRTHGRRTLPWRTTRDPWKVLVSEIMLQQTQVDRVLPKYRAFVKQFPTPMALATAPAALVLRAWQGMGYNRRALFLKRAAEAIVRSHGGKVPSAYEALRALPGIGDYTARAVQTFAFGERVALIDTNIRRIFARYHFGKNPSAVAEARITPRVEEAIPRTGERTRTYNGALMDFGSLVCRTTPLCAACPLRLSCKTAPQVLLHGVQALAGRVVRSPQKAFAGSDRQLRGRIIEYLRTHSSATPAALAHACTEPHPRVRTVLTGLLHDGLVKKKNGSAVALP